MKHIFTALSLSVAALSAHATVYQSVAPQASAIQFSYGQMGVAMQGQFKRFDAQVLLDTQKPEAAQGSLSIDLASIDTGSAEADDEVVGKAWFNVKAYPKATFTLQSLQAKGPGQYLASGQLSIKGKTHTLNAPLTLSPKGLLSGNLVIKRADYGIGEGMWSAFDVVANEITVQFTLQLN